MIRKIVSSGQTGVERAALDVALLFNIPIGGFCSKKCLAEDGKVDPKYLLQEAKENDVTRKNIENSDGTLVLGGGEIKGTSELTKIISDELKKPCLVLDLNHYPSPTFVLDWIHQNSISVLNVEGPHESEAPGIYAVAYDFLIAVFQLEMA